MNKLNLDLGQVFTPKLIAEIMVNMFDGDKASKLLEPCFGNGVFLEFLDRKFTEIDAIELDKNLFESVKEKNKKSSIRFFNQDFLEFESQEKYDGIIMNPPYIRHEKINELKTYGINKNNLRKKSIFKNLSSTSNLYMYFILKAIDLLKENGELIVIFPNTWKKSHSGKIFLENLKENGTIVEEVFITGKVFGKDVLVEVIILKILKCKKNQEPKIKQYLYENERLVMIEKNDCQISSNNHKLLLEYASLRRGLTTGYNEFFINKFIDNNFSSKNINYIISTPKAISGYSTKDSIFDEIFITTEKKENLNNFEREYIEKEELKIEATQKPKTIYEKLKAEKEWYKLKKFDCQGIIFSYIIRNNMKFIMNSEKKYIVRDNFYLIIPKINSNLLFALLNNYYTFYRLEKLGKLHGGGLLKLQKYDLEKIEILDINILEKEDKDLLELLADKLIVESDEKIILEITQIISKYENIGLYEVIEKYKKKKNIRLKG